jgi:hypothetical protein
MSVHPSVRLRITAATATADIRVGPRICAYTHSTRSEPRGPKGVILLWHLAPDPQGFGPVTSGGSPEFWFASRCASGQKSSFFPPPSLPPTDKSPYTFRPASVPPSPPAIAATDISLYTPCRNNTCPQSRYCSYVCACVCVCSCVYVRVCAGCVCNRESLLGM